MAKALMELLIKIINGASAVLRWIGTQTETLIDIGENMELQRKHKVYFAVLALAWAGIAWVHVTVPYNTDLSYRMDCNMYGDCFAVKR